ncbi:MAG: PepSY domain-containing protein [Nevskiales bacterium]
MRKHLVLALVTAAVLGGPLAIPAYAKQDKRERVERSEDDRKERSERSERGDSHKGVLSRDEAARRVQRQHGGKVLSVDLLQSDDAPARYRVKLLSDGNVRTIDVDALED